MFEVVCTLGVIILSLVILIHKLRHKSLSFLNGPTPLPFIGNAMSLWNMEDILPMLGKWGKEFGGVYKLYLGLKPYLIITDYKFAEYVLSSNALINKGDDYKTLETIFGDSLLISSGEKWRKRRKVFTPSFHFKILESFIKVFDDNGKILVEKLKDQLGKDSFDINKIFSLYTLDVICESAMGTSVHAQNLQNTNYVNAINRCCKIALDKTISIMYAIPGLYKFTSLYQTEQNDAKIIHGFTDNIIKQRRNKLLTKKEILNQEDDIGLKKRLSFLDVLLQSTIDGKPLSDSDIRDEVNIFMFEGHDTTSIALSAAIVFIANDKKVQNRIIDEMQGIFGNDPDRAVTYQDLSEMKYLEQVIKETMRLCPSVPIFSRKIKEDFKYEGNVYPKGLNLAIVPYLIHRNEEYFPNSEKFDPSRFESGEETKRPVFGYIPFSAGARNCIGQKFAMLEMKTALFHVLKEFEVLPAIPKHQPIFTILVTLKSLNGMCVRLKRREIL